MKKVSNQHQDFDKIFKENLGEIIFSLTEELCGLKIEKFEDINLSLQRTREKRPDYAKFAVNPNEKYILHIEIQTANDKDMPFRMLEYFEYFYRKHGVNVEQFLLYIGKEKLSMSPNINLKNLWFEYKIIDFRSIDYRQFINSDKPESIILAILCDYKANNPRTIISEILQNLANSETENLQKYVFQLRILSELRNLEETTLEEVEKMPSRFNIDFTKDPYYQRGLMLGMNEGVSQGISQGIYQGEQNILTRMLEKKFGKLKSSVIKNIRQLSVVEIESLTDVFFEFNKVQDLETWLKNVKLRQEKVAQG